MIVAVGYYVGDLDQAFRLADWVRELGPYHGHSMIVARDKTALAHPFADCGFDSVQEFEVTDDAWRSWPQSCNNVFQKIGRILSRERSGEPFLWIEPDVVPMRRGWLDAIAEEYKASNKLFLGDFVSVHTPQLDVPDHMSGVGVYPANIMEKCTGAVMLCDDLAWDVSGAPEILPRMATSRLILHAWKHPVFLDMEAVQREIFAFKPECALFHASKDGSLIRLLREGRQEAKPKLALVGTPAQDESSLNLSNDNAGSNPAPLEIRSLPQVNRELLRETFRPAVEEITCDILIKTYPPDYELLNYCLRSIDKFARGFRKVIVVAPNGADKFEFGLGSTRTKVETVWVSENGANGYLFQQAVKMNAHKYSDADYILHLDSDCFLTLEITPDFFFRDGKPYWLMTEYSKIETPWREPTEKFIGFPVEWEFMRRFPILVPRSIHAAAEGFCILKHGKRLEDYIMEQPIFSEFNALGALAFNRAHDDFVWLDTNAAD